MKQISHFVQYCDVQSNGNAEDKSTEEEASGFFLFSWILQYFFLSLELMNIFHLGTNITFFYTLCIFTFIS